MSNFDLLREEYYKTESSNDLGDFIVWMTARARDLYHEKVFTAEEAMTIIDEALCF